MIPQNRYPTVQAAAGEKNYLLRGDRMGTACSGVKALRGWITLALSTERYAYPIFSAGFGLDCRVGEWMSDQALSSAIRSALMVDERILSVDGFTITREGGEVSAAFTVDSVYGAFETKEIINV